MDHYHLTPWRGLPLANREPEELETSLSEAIHSHHWHWPHVHMFSPDVDIDEDDRNIHVHVDLPGMSKDDIQVEIRDGMLSLKGERKPAPGLGQRQRTWIERRYGPFHRFLELPAEVVSGKVSAVFRNGVLNITMPKKAPRKIEVKVK